MPVGVAPGTAPLGVVAPAPGVAAPGVPTVDGPLGGTSPRGVDGIAGEAGVDGTTGVVGCGVAIVPLVVVVPFMPTIGAVGTPVMAGAGVSPAAPPKPLPGEGMLLPGIATVGNPGVVLGMPSAPELVAVPPITSPPALLVVTPPVLVDSGTVAVPPPPWLGLLSLPCSHAASATRATLAMQSVIDRLM